MSRINLKQLSDNHTRFGYAGTGGVARATASISQTTDNPIVSTDPQPESGRITLPRDDTMTKKQFVQTVAMDEDLHLAGMKKKSYRNKEVLPYDPLGANNGGFIMSNSGNDTSGDSKRYGDPEEPAPLYSQKIGASNYNPTGLPAGEGSNAVLNNVQEQTPKIRGKIML